ncbi:hypothetical protein F5Y17DRAFT_155230 [Xylariaceae sp. FL0594]|nr:hypothetical protein F5Y17DRAFT_155230 [Xylariaceae sp. FL0594]
MLILPHLTIIIIILIQTLLPSLQTVQIPSIIKPIRNRLVAPPDTPFRGLGLHDVMVVREGGGLGLRHGLLLLRARPICRGVLDLGAVYLLCQLRLVDGFLVALHVLLHRRALPCLPEDVDGLPMAVAVDDFFLERWAFLSLREVVDGLPLLVVVDDVLLEAFGNGVPRHLLVLLSRLW